MSKLVIAISALILLISCEHNEVSENFENDYNISSEFSSEQQKIVSEHIKNYYGIDNEREKSISLVSTRKFSNFLIVTFKNRKNEIKEIAFKDPKFVNGKFDTEVNITCSGDCDCSLEGISGGGSDDYIQCKCSECKMHYNSGKQSEENNLVDLAKISFTKTFDRTPSNLKITETNIVKHSNATVMTIFYTDDSGVESTFMRVTKYNDTQSSDTDELKTGTVITVDCHGDCDCRERFFPETGAIECSCNSCVMDVID